MLKSLKIVDAYMRQQTAIIALNNAMSPLQRHAISWSNAASLLIGP